MVRRLLTSAVVYTLGWLVAVGLWGDVFLNSDAIHYYAAAEAWYVHRWQDWTAEEYLQSVEPFRYLFRVEPTTGQPTSFYPPGMAIVLWPGMALGDAGFRRVTLAGWAYVPYPLGRVLGAWAVLGSLTIWAMVVLEILVTAWAGVRPGRARWAILLTFWGTPWLYYASRAPLFSHAAEVALLILGLGGIRMAESSRSAWQRLGGVVSGLAWGAAVATRYALLLWVVPASLATVVGIGRARRAAATRWALWGLVGVAPWAAFLLGYQATWMEHIGATGYSPRLFVWNYPWPEALRWIGFRAWALWLHPVRGFAVWHPIVLAALLGWTRISGLSRPLALTSTVGLLGITLTYHDWWAGVSCGQRLLMGLVPWIPFGIARFLETPMTDPMFPPRRSVQHWFRWAIAGGFTLWNVLLTVGFIAGAWRGYDDGRLGERFPFYHILHQMGRDITATARAFRQATWASLGHVRHWLRPPTVLSGPSLHAERPPLGFITPPRSDAPAAGPVHPPPWVQWWTWSVQVPADGTVRWVVQIYTGPPYRFPSNWFITAVSDPVPVLAGSETWRLRIGYPSPFVALWRGTTPIPVRRHYESLSRLLLSESLDSARIFLIQHFYPSGSTATRWHPMMTVWDLRPTPPWRPREALRCIESYVDTQALPIPKVVLRPDVPVLAYARPFSGPPWFQGVRTFRTLDPVPVLFRPMPVAAGPYRGYVILCQESSDPL